MVQKKLRHRATDYTNPHHSAGVCGFEFDRRTLIPQEKRR